jgi:hypothetical protein
MSTNLHFAAGEMDVEEANFSPSVVLFWLRTSIGVSTTRIVTRRPNTILGIIPLGYSDANYPLANVASVNVSTKFYVGRLIFFLIFLIAGFASVAKIPGLGILLLIIAADILANTFKAGLMIVNNAGGKERFTVSIFQKSKLEQFREVINQRLFADHAAIRHNQHMQVQNEQLMVQQQQLTAQIMQQNAQMQMQPQMQMQQQPQQQVYEQPQQPVYQQPQQPVYQQPQQQVYEQPQQQQYEQPQQPQQSYPDDHPLQYLEQFMQPDPGQAPEAS